MCGCGPVSSSTTRFCGISPPPSRRPSPTAPDRQPPLLTQPTPPSTRAVLKEPHSVSDRLALRSGPPPTHQAGPAPASPSQARLWFADQMGGHGLEFVYPYAMRLHGPLDTVALGAALDAVVARHETLRTTFMALDGAPFQKVQETAPFELTAEELAPVGSDSPEEALRMALHSVIELPFDLVAGPVLRARLWRTASDEHVLLLVIHHIATDGWSMDILFRELGEAYDALAAGGAAEFTPLLATYRDITRRELERSRSKEWAEDLAYWREHLRDCPHVLDLPVDRPRPAVRSSRGRHFSFEVPATTTAGIETFARTGGASTYMVLLAAFQLLLAQWSGQRDFIVGVPVANREASDTEGVVGFFMNILPVRARPDFTGSFRGLLASVRDVTLDAADYQHVSFGQLVEEIAPERSLAHNVLVQVTFNMEREVRLSLDGIRTEQLDVRPDISRYDIALDYLVTTDGSLRFGVSYSSDLFEEETVRALTQRYVHLLGTVLARPDVALAELPLQETALDRAALALGAGPVPVAPRADVITRLLEATDAAPDSPAVVEGADSLTFAELADRSAAIARHVAAEGGGPGTVVGVCMTRSADLLATALGVQRAGAAYLPLDPNYPAERLAYLVRDSGARLVLTRDQDPVPEDVQALANTVRIDPESASGAGGELPAIRPEQDAYVIYTSGSTGQPKGVQVAHASLADLVAGLAESGAVRAKPGRVGWNASPSFDASVAQWSRVCRGDTIVVVPEEVRQAPERLAAFAARERLTDLHVTPSLAEHLVEHLQAEGEAVGGLRLWVGGEQISPGLWQALAELGSRTGFEAINIYGTSETAVDNIWAPVTAGTRVHLAAVLPGQHVRVLDAALRPAPRGVRGEVYVAGPGVARGYLGRPGLTASRFLPDPWGPAGTRMYRTGDLARWTADGHLDVLGRNDLQVKVRGYRIEPGEVETVLAELPEVIDCAIVRTERDGTGTLTAFVRLSHEGNVDRLREHAARRLPEWMRPSLFVPLTEMPLTPAGKLDRLRLGSGTELAVAEPEPADEPAPVAPLTATEELLIKVCQDVLKVEGLRPTDHFFDVGGHSLLAIRVVARIKRRTKLNIPMTAVLEYPVIADLAVHIEQIIRDRIAAS
ncbi:amino acid adenylation domain-containing protein [Streptomyces sp. NPDC006530]|uniref:non-ribosomal peptide synthetase n=1 Tax=Streptomyces sp. NPDC006530 TaxID=3364750 RepID=UPI003677A4AD